MAERRHLPDENGGTLHALPLVQAAEEFEQVVENEVREMPTRADVNRVARRSDRNRNVVLAIVGLVSVIALLLGGRAMQGVAETTAANKINSASIDALNQARDQLKAQGVPEKDLPPPVVQPSPGTDVDVNAIVQATAAIVLAQIKSDPTFRGPTGATGLNGMPCDPVIQPACVGPQGIQGLPGIEGKEGPQGIPGQNGTDGAKGDKGDRGTDAPTPISASFVDTDPDPVGVTCVYRTTYRREDNSTFDLDAPTNAENCP